MNAALVVLAMFSAFFAASAVAGQGAPGIFIPPAASPSMDATMRVRLRFFHERNDPKAKDWTPQKADAAKRELDALNRDAERIAKDEFTLPKRQTLLMGYRSDLDDSDQPYSLYIPEEYDPAKPTPLVVMLHGQGMFNPLQCNATRVGKMLVVAPQGRGGMDYMYVGEGDVLNVIAETQKYLNVDVNRVYLAGGSMGGSGSWHLASHFPDRFGGIMPLCGNTDINVWQERWLWLTPKDSPIAKVRHFLREDTCAITYAENLHNVGIVSLQGEADPIVNQMHARRMAERLASLGHPNFKIHMLPLVTHAISANYELGLQDFARNPKPSRVRFQTAWLRYPGAYWLRINGIEQRLSHAKIDGTADPETRSINVKTHNVAAIEIDRSKLPFDGAPSHVVIDGAELDVAQKDANVLRFEKSSDNMWRAEGAASAANLFPPPKNALVEGPAEHAFMSRFVVVPGEDPEYQKCADEFNALWKTRFAVNCRMKTSKEVTRQDIADSNLILIGMPEKHALLKPLMEKLPLSFEKDGIRLNQKLYSGPNLGTIFCYPNPLNPRRYVVLISGTTPQSYAGIHVRFGNWFDWIPYDFRKHYDFAVFDDLTSGHDPETFLVWGFFGEKWEYRPESTFTAVPAWREKLRPRIFPKTDIAGLKPQERPAVLHLDEAFTKSERLNKEYLERNRTLDGGVLQINGKDFERGLCARFPCSITFDCAGYSRLKVTAGVAWDGKTELSEDRKASEKVTVVIQADGKTLFEAFECTYRSAPTEIDIDLKGATTLTLSAFGGLSWLNGSFIWAGARLEGPTMEPVKKDAKD